MQNVVVTGASTGIGLAITKALLQNNFHVFGSVRKESDAARLKQELGEQFEALVFDITDEIKTREAASLVRTRLAGRTLSGLVNNAGIAVPGVILHQPIDEFRYQMEVNLIGQMIVTQAFVPLLGADASLQGGPGRIVNISSEAGLKGLPFLGAYVASKHALEGFSEVLRRELMLYGIDVIIIGPGAIATPIWDKAEEVDLTPYQSTDYFQAAQGFQKYMVESGRKGYPPEKVAQVTLQALTSSNPRVRYAVVPGNPISNAFQGWLPARVVDGFIARSLGFKRK